MKKLKPTRSISKALKDFQPEFFGDNFAEEFWNEVQNKIKKDIKKMLELTFDFEAELIIKNGVASNPEKKIYRNGYYPRKEIITPFGPINNVKRPKLRNASFASKILPPHQRMTNEFTSKILNIYSYGKTSKKLADLLEDLYDVNISKSTISNKLKKLEKELSEYRNKKIKDIYKVLILDGIWMGIKTFSTIKNKKTSKSVMLAVMGIKEDNTKEIIGFRVGRSESMENWYGLLQDLTDRGLKLKKEGIVIYDGAKGLHSAVDMFFPYQTKQLCVFHFIKGIKQYVDGKSKAKKFSIEVSKIYKNARSKKEIIKKMREFILKHKKEKRLLKYIERNFEKTTSYFNYKDSEWKTLKTTNLLERAFRETRKLIRNTVVFQNIASSERLLFISVKQLNMDWRRHA